MGALLVLAILGLGALVLGSGGKKSGGGPGGYWDECIDPAMAPDERKETILTLEWLSDPRTGQLTADERAAVEAAANAAESKGYMKLAACLRDNLKGH